MKKELKRVSLSKETIIRLDNLDLTRGVRGGEAWSEQSVCPTVTPSDCKPCS